MIICGIDPGEKGGISFLEDTGKGLEVFPMPIRSEEKQGAYEVDTLALYNILNSYSEEKFNTKVFVEKVGPFPKSSRLASFNFGRNYEAILSCLKILELPYQRIPPQSWKLILKGTNKSKQAAIIWACNSFPYLNIGCKDDGIAESLCIAEYGRRLIVGSNN